VRERRSHTSFLALQHPCPYLFFPLSNCTYNSHIIKNKNFLAYFMGILNSWVVYKLQTINPGYRRTGRHFTGGAEKICPERNFFSLIRMGLKPLVNLFYTLEFVYNGFVCNVNSPITLHFVRPDGIFHMHFNSLVTSFRQ